MATRICCSFLHKSPDLKEQYLNFSVQRKRLTAVFNASFFQTIHPDNPTRQHPWKRYKMGIFFGGVWLYKFPYLRMSPL